MKHVETLNEGLKRAYTLTITAKDIEAKIDAELKAVAPTVRMPGFRPGKVPANLVRKMHGEALAQDALQKSVQEGVDGLMRAEKLRPAMQPSVLLAEGYATGKDAEITVELEVLPEFDVPSLDGLALERLTVPVDDAAVEEQINRLLGQSKKFDDAAKSYKAAAGDQVVIDFAGSVDGVPFDGGTGEDMAVEIGSGMLIPGFEDQLIGAKLDEERVLNVTFPMIMRQKTSRAPPRNSRSRSRPSKSLLKRLRMMILPNSLACKASISCAKSSKRSGTGT